MADVDKALDQLSGPLSRKVLCWQFEIFGDARFVCLCKLSNGHLFNLRKTRTYRNVRQIIQPTCPTQIAIGERQPSAPDARQFDPATLLPLEIVHVSLGIL